jgi:hypothetical protein
VPSTPTAPPDRPRRLDTATSTQRLTRLLADARRRGDHDLAAVAGSFLETSRARDAVRTVEQQRINATFGVTTHA